MRKFKNILAVALVCMLALVSLPVAQLPAAAAGEVDISASTSPSSLSAAGSSTITVTVKNNTDSAITSVTISYPGTTDVIDSIAAGASKTSKQKVSISASQLGNPIDIKVDWKGSDGADSQTVTALVEKGAASSEASVDFTRTSSAKTASSGDKVTLTYTVKNNGSDSITGVSITDPATSKSVVSGATINAGASKSYTAEITVTKDVTSTPTLKYTSGGSSQTKKLDGLKIAVGQAKGALQLSAKADKTEVTKGSKVTFTITLKNTSSSELNKIKLVDDQGAVVRESASVNAGKSPTVTYSLTMDKSRKVSFIATYPAGSETDRVKTDPIEIKVDGEAAGDTDGTGKIVISTATASPEEITEFPATVTLKVQVKNDGETDLSNITVEEAKLGEIGTLSELKAGKTKTFTKETKVTEAGSFTFSVKAEDVAGNEYTASSKGVTVTAATPAPEATLEPTETPKARGSLGTLAIVLIVIVVLIILSAIALIVLVVKERKSKQNSKNGKNGPKGSGPNGKKRSTNPDRRENPQQVEGRRRRPDEAGTRDGQQPRRRPADDDAPRPRRRPMDDDLEKTQVIGGAAGFASEGMDSTQEMPRVDNDYDDGYDDYHEPPRRRRRPVEDDEAVERPRRRPVESEYEDDYAERPRRTRQPEYDDDEYVERPRRRRPAVDDSEDAPAPRRRRRPPVDDDDFEERPRRPRATRPDDDDDFEYGPPRRRR